MAEPNEQPGLSQVGEAIARIGQLEQQLRDQGEVLRALQDRLSRLDASTQAAALSVKQTAVLLGVGVSTVWQIHAAGKMPRPIKIGGLTKWVRAELLAWIEAGAPPRPKWTLLKENRRWYKPPG